MELKRVDSKNLWEIIKLTVSDGQKNFVATNTNSILEAYVTITSNSVALPFGLYEDNTLVGFIMIGFGTTGEASEPQIASNNYCLWRLMIDKKYQGRGLGRKAVETAIDYVKTWPCGESDYFWLSYEPENIVARHLYQSLGFHENGEICGNEIVSVYKF